MQLRITDLLDEYMYDDIPMDSVGDGGTRAKKPKKNPNHRRIGQMVAATVIALCVFVTGSLYFTGTEGGKSLSDDPQGIPEEALTASLEGAEDMDEMKPEVSVAPEPTPSIQPEPTPELSETPDVEYSVFPTPVPEVTPTPIPSVTPTVTPEDGVEVWDDTEAVDDNYWYSQVISLAPDGASVTVTDPDTDAIWGFGDFSFDEDEGYFHVTLTYLGFDREAILVGSEEQMRLGQAAEPEAQFFVMDGLLNDGTAFCLPNPELVSADTEHGRYQYKVRWQQAASMATIKEFYLRKANGL